MKKIFCSFLIIVLSLILCCCQTERTIKEKTPGKDLTDGTKTYYITEYNTHNQKIHLMRYNDKDVLIEEYIYNYYTDINGKTVKIKETNLKTGNYTETMYDKFNKKYKETVYSKKNIILSQQIYLKNGNVQKSYIYKDGKETGYIIYDYYTDNQLKSESEYRIDEKPVKIKTYYKNANLYQIKEYGENGFVEKITKYSYKNEKVCKESIYDSEFNLIQITDYSKNPPEIIKYEK